MYSNLITFTQIACRLLLYCSWTTFALSLPLSSSDANVEMSASRTSRLDNIRSMFAWEGFVYALDVRSADFIAYIRL